MPTRLSGLDSLMWLEAYAATVMLVSSASVAPRPSIASQSLVQRLYLAKHASALS